MTNTKTRTTRKEPAALVTQGEEAEERNDRGQLRSTEREEPWRPLEAIADEGFAFAPSAPGQDTFGGTEDDDEEEDDVTSCSSFSLQECINEFRARRIRRISTHSRDAPPPPLADEIVPPFPGNIADPEDEDLINQNRSNKEQERKCKPCKNGFCYCFTSDSGDGGGVACGRNGFQTRQSRRNRRSDIGQAPSCQAHRSKSKEVHRRSAPPSLKCIPQSPTQSAASPEEESCEQLTAISRLETSSKDAPLIHIIQELRDNCVISEVRVNKHKIREQQISTNLCASPKKTHFQLNTVEQDTSTQPTAPPLNLLSPVRQVHMSHEVSEEEDLSDEGTLVYTSPLDMSARSVESSGRRRHKAGGLLLQKRLSHSKAELKPCNLQKPPPKPPRISVGFDEKVAYSGNSLTSTSPSLREAERILDEFLMRKGFDVPGSHEKTAKNDNERVKRKSFAVQAGDGVVGSRKSYPLTRLEERGNLPTCPSLSDIERDVRTKQKRGNYDQNIRQKDSEKPVKEVFLGWAEPKIVEMLNYDSNPRQDNRKQFRSQSTQAEPQTIGWKVDLDTVDGAVRPNLASEYDVKSTPTKNRVFPTQNFSKFSPWSERNGAKNCCVKLKSNLKSSSRSFLKNSKKKILRLVSPKKDNKAEKRFEARRTPLRSMATQTSSETLLRSPYESGTTTTTTPQSPPESYDSPLQQQEETRQGAVPEGRAFDFTRTVEAPAKRSTRSTQRRLNFPLNCVSCDPESVRSIGVDAMRSSRSATKTYRSYQSELDQDVTLSKMGYILTNIRAKLEASDEHAQRTFQEVSRRTQQFSGFDCPDSQKSSTSHSSAKDSSRCPTKTRPQRLETVAFQEPIYSEIEEDSIHISGSAEFDNKTGQNSVATNVHPEELYAKVNKKPKPKVITKPNPAPALFAPPPMALGKFLHDSLRKSRGVAPFAHLPSLPEPSATSEGETVFYSSPPPSLDAHPSLPHCQSLNNIREKHSPPKRNRNISKSDLSLQRSEIFLENLCCTEIPIDGVATDRLQKVDNHEASSLHNTSFNSNAGTTTQDESVSYQLPNESDDFELDFQANGSHFGFSAIEPPEIINQSTPKQKTGSSAGAQQPKCFMTKLFSDDPHQQDLSVQCGQDCVDAAPCLLLHNQPSSCPTTPFQVSTPDYTPSRQPHSHSLSEIFTYDHNHQNNQSNNNCNNNSRISNTEFTASNNSSKTNNHNNSKASSACSCTSARYQRLKNALQNSFRRSKRFLKFDRKRLSLSLLSTATPTSGPGSHSHDQSEDALNSSTTESSFNLETLFGFDETVDFPVTDQILRVVSICRQLPELEISSEMVEAERLLLYSNIRREPRPAVTARFLSPRSLIEYNQKRSRRFFIDGLRLPVRENPSQDIFFNYFYFVTFECDEVIRSSQSVECRDQLVLFSDCGIEFVCGKRVGEEREDIDAVEVRCNIFMLRLRKVSTLSMEPRRAPTIKLSSSSSSFGDEITSRFRLQASFTLRARDFAPYEFVERESQCGDKIVLRCTRKCRIPLTETLAKSTNLAGEIEIDGRAEVRLAKRNHRGFLNVRDPHSQHSWNRRWCTLEGLQMRVWHDDSNSSDQCLFCLDLHESRQQLPMVAATVELCARQRSFFVECAISRGGEEVPEKPDVAAVFFAAESQADLDTWLLQLNAVLRSLAEWTQ